VNNHKEVQLQLQDLNFAKLNQIRTRIMERTSKQASTTEAVMPTIKKMEQNCIATHLYNKHLGLLDLLGKHLRLSGPSKGVALCKHLRKKCSVAGLFSRNIEADNKTSNPLSNQIMTNMVLSII
jgi:hypothetical protein